MPSQSIALVKVGLLLHNKNLPAPITTLLLCYRASLKLHHALVSFLVFPLVESRTWHSVVQFDPLVELHKLLIQCLCLWLIQAFLPWVRAPTNRLLRPLSTSLMVWGSAACKIRIVEWQEAHCRTLHSRRRSLYRWKGHQYAIVPTRWPVLELIPICASSCPLSYL